MKFITISKYKECTEKYYKKEEFLNCYSDLQKRDINLIDRTLQFKDSDIITKKDIIIVKLHYLRCIITKDIVYIVSDIEKNISKNIINTFINSIIKKENIEIYFSLKILELIFENVRDYFDDKIMDDTAHKVALYQDCLDPTINSYKKLFTKEFTIFYNSLSLLKAKITDIKDLFDDLDNLELNELSLFDLEQNNINDNSIKIIKDLIDYYKTQFEENYNDLTRQKETIDNLLKIIQLRIGETRNKMTKFSIYLNSFSVSFLIPALVFSSFGMNIPNNFEDEVNSFWIIWILVLIISISVFFMILNFFKNYIDF